MSVEDGHPVELQCQRMGDDGLCTTVREFYMLCRVESRLWLGGLADQQVVGSGERAGGDAEERIERGMPCPAPIEAEHELVQVVLEVRSAQSMVNAQAPALEV